MIDEQTFKKFDFNGAKGLVFFGDRILVYKRDSKAKMDPLRMDLPGGGRESNESPFETFAREVQEEFGILIKQDDIFYSCSFPSSQQPGKLSFFIVTKPLDYKEADVVFGDEGIEWCLMKPEEFINRTDGIARQLNRVIKYLKGEKILE